jgi:hypothetical protein
LDAPSLPPRACLATLLSLNPVTNGIAEDETALEKWVLMGGLLCALLVLSSVERGSRPPTEVRPSDPLDANPGIRLEDEKYIPKNIEYNFLCLFVYIQLRSSL